MRKKALRATSNEPQLKQMESIISWVMEKLDNMEDNSEAKRKLQKQMLDIFNNEMLPKLSHLELTSSLNEIPSNDKNDPAATSTSSGNRSRKRRIRREIISIF